MSGALGGGQDTHSSVGASSGPADSYTATQYYGYRCLRCNPGAVDNTLAWQKNVLGPIVISRFVEMSDGAWRYRITKNGYESTVLLTP
jgi:hypothetical protein